MTFGGIPLVALDFYEDLEGDSRRYLIRCGREHKRCAGDARAVDTPGKPHSLNVCVLLRTATERCVRGSSLQNARPTHGR
jgi:hypothetical protein